jgi:hypothetical protein
MTQAAPQEAARALDRKNRRAPAGKVEAEQDDQGVRQDEQDHTRR